jgi:Lrp/AsnC family transcriptional regulator, leucine-responsive regulatory protein
MFIWKSRHYVGLMLDSKDEAILLELKKNARQSTKTIAKKVGIPRVTVHDRIRKMVESGVITSFTTAVDQGKIGLPTMMFVFVSFLPNHDISQRQLAHRIALFTGVEEVHIVSGEYDLLLKVRGSSLEEIGRLVVDRLRQVKGVGNTVTFACFETVKDDR